MIGSINKAHNYSRIQCLPEKPITNELGIKMALVQSVLNQFPYDESNSTLYLTTFSCFVGIVFVIMLTRKRNKSSINLPPSPPKLPIIGNLHQLGTLPHHSFHALAKKYGPLMFLQLGQTPTLVVSSADVAKEITKNHDVAFSNRPQSTAAKTFLYDCKDLAFASYGEEWRQKKKLCVLELLSLKRVKSFQSIREEEVAELVGTITKACEKTESSVNLSEMFVAISTNIVSRCVLGQKYDTPNGSNNKSFGELGKKVLRLFGTFSVRDFFPCLGWIDNVTGLIPEMKATFVALDAFFEDVIEEHKRMRKNGGGDEQSDTKDFVDILLQLQESGIHDFELTRDNIKAILMDMFVGGTDTTSTALEWIFTELIKNPNIIKKVQEEVRRIVGNKSKVDENDLNQMSYLKCVIKESLRLHPPGPLLVPRETLSSSKIKGYDIPPKTRVIMNAWTIQRDPKLWDNPEEFIPERFESSQIDFKGQDFQLIPFGTGRRGCPGISFGSAASEYVLANLLYWFDWKISNEAGGYVDMNEVHGLAVTKKVPLHLEPTLHSFGFKA